MSFLWGNVKTIGEMSDVTKFKILSGYKIVYKNLSSKYMTQLNNKKHKWEKFHSWYPKILKHQGKRT